MFAHTPEVVDRDGASRFVDALGQTSAPAWLQAAGMACAASEARARVVDAVLARVERLGIREDLWHLADAVETAAWYALPQWCRTPRSRSDAMTRRHAIEAGCVAAYAVLLRAHITDQEFDLLYAPFHEVMQGTVRGMNGERC